MQENVAQPPPAQTQPTQAQRHGSDAPPGANISAPAQTSQDSAAEAQTPSTDLGLSQILEQHIAQAIQPVLDEFRQQMTQEVAQQTAAVHMNAAGGQVSVQESPHGPGSQEPMQPPPTLQPPVQPPPQQAAAQQTPGSQPPPPPPSASPSQVSAQEPSAGQHGAERPLAGALAPVVQAVEHQGAQWLQSLLVAGVGALLSESTCAAVQQRAEQGLHTVVQKLFDAAPDSVMTPEMQAKTERTLQLILRESLDAVFAEGVRTTLQQGGQQTVQQSLHGDFRAASRRVEDMLRVMVDALMAVLRRHQQTIVRLVLALVLLALANSLAQPEKAK
jgi:hypothetical protein